MNTWKAKQRGITAKWAPIPGPSSFRQTGTTPRAKWFRRMKLQASFSMPVFCRLVHDRWGMLVHPTKGRRTGAGTALPKGGSRGSWWRTLVGETVRRGPGPVQRGEPRGEAYAIVARLSNRQRKGFAKEVAGNMDDAGDARIEAANRWLAADCRWIGSP